MPKYSDVEGDILGKINILSSQTADKIAAGEVVERPSSVVKELIENSLDAGARNITIEISEGGEKYIKVADDGCGILKEDIEKAFLPHATSKISSIEDIYSLNTMGFRGEALASIASVSNVILKSKTKDCTCGEEISISGSSINYIKDTGCNTGTIIEVKDLFYNVPARLKFLKSVQSESTNINSITEKLAIANPDVCFKYINNGKNIVTTYGNGNCTDVLRCVYSKNITENITQFEKHEDKASVYGYIGNAEISRGSRNSQSIFVNKRYIKNKLITAAVENAFKSFLTINKFPFFVVFIDIYPEYIDVNVHPQKAEIKFRDEREIFKLVFDAVHSALRDQYITSFDESSPQNIIAESNNDTYARSTEKKPIQLPVDLKTEKDFKENISTDDYSMKESVNNTNSTNSTIGIDNDKKVPKFPECNIIGQFNKTYILAESHDELYIIDQHAAHEKILFEMYMNSISSGKVVSQILLTPVVFEMSSEDYNCFTENSTVFESAGFTFDIFGDKTISVREVPLFLGKPDLKSLLFDMIDNLKNMGNGETSEVKYDRIAKLACRSAVKANDTLTKDEMKSLIDQLRYINDPFTCPHGRPTIIKFSLNELEKKFKRIQ